MCYIEDEDGQPLFKVKVVEKGHDDLILTGPTPKGKYRRVKCFQTGSGSCDCCIRSNC